MDGKAGHRTEDCEKLSVSHTLGCIGMIGESLHLGILTTRRLRDWEDVRKSRVGDDAVAFLRVLAQLKEWRRGCGPHT